MLLIIGLDGADWRLLDPWLQEGVLPTLAAFKARARWGRLSSTIRPESSIAWTTFATGVNAGKHGVFGFVGQRPHDYGVELNTAASIRATPFWQLAGAAGKRIALLNTPMTFPPHPIPNVTTIAGMLTPDIHYPFTQPSDLQKRLLDAVPDYVINVDRTGMSLFDFLRATTRAIEARGEAARWLLCQQEWDAFVVVFTATDRLQHYTLHLLHPDHPRHHPEEARRLVPELKKAYQTLDRALAKLLDVAGPGATVILLSDHGFGPVSRAFYVNAFLAETGWLTWKRKPMASVSVWRRLRRHPSLRRFKKRLPGVRKLRRPPALAPWLTFIDWSQTKAYYSPTGGIRFNVRGREPAGVVDIRDLHALTEALRSSLLQARDPRTGHSPIADIFAREDLYHGPMTSLAPDLIIEPKRASMQPEENFVIRSGFSDHAFGESGEITGNHALQGILAAAGPHISSGMIQGAALMDLAPTILQLLDVPIPIFMDGRVLDFARGRPIFTSESERAESLAKPDLSDEDQRILQERLRSLGYL